MSATVSVNRRFQSWPASIAIFTVASLGEFTALTGWFRLHAGHLLIALLVLWAGFIVERWMVVLWLQVPKRVITPGGRLRSLIAVLAGVTLAEIVVWAVSLALAENGEPGFAAATLLLGIHVVHSYEVALLKHRTLEVTLRDPHVWFITGIETVGGVSAFFLATQEMYGAALATILVALVVEHVFQVVGLKNETAIA